MNDLSIGPTAENWQPLAHSHICESSKIANVSKKDPTKNKNTLTNPLFRKYAYQYTHKIRSAIQTSRSRLNTYPLWHHKRINSIHSHSTFLDHFTGSFGSRSPTDPALSRKTRPALELWESSIPPLYFRSED